MFIVASLACAKPPAQPPANTCHRDGEVRCSCPSSLEHHPTPAPYPANRRAFCAGTLHSIGPAPLQNARVPPDDASPSMAAESELRVLVLVVLLVAGPAWTLTKTLSKGWLSCYELFVRHIS